MLAKPECASVMVSRSSLVATPCYTTPAESRGCAVMEDACPRTVTVWAPVFGLIVTAMSLTEPSEIFTWDRASSNP
jgi:hypothetical protein